MSSDTFAASRIRALKGAAGAGFVLLATGGAAAQEDPAVFYAGKTVRIIVGVSVGSGYDIAARTVGRHIGKYIPGKPNIIVQNQPGAGSATMSNALYASGPRDGTVIGAPFNGMPTMPPSRLGSIRRSSTGSAVPTVPFRRRMSGALSPPYRPWRT